MFGWYPAYVVYVRLTYMTLCTGKLTVRGEGQSQCRQWRGIGRWVVQIFTNRRRERVVVDYPEYPLPWSPDWPGGSRYAGRCCTAYKTVQREGTDYPEY